jgi:hypothetical protein
MSDWSRKVFGGQQVSMKECEWVEGSRRGGDGSFIYRNSPSRPILCSLGPVGRWTIKEAASGSAIESYQQITWGNRQRLTLSHVFCNHRCQQQPGKVGVILRVLSFRNSIYVRL